VKCLLFLLFFCLKSIFYLIFVKFERKFHLPISAAMSNSSFSFLHILDLTDTAFKVIDKTKDIMFVQKYCILSQVF
jgi:hypothetical protein